MKSTEELVQLLEDESAAIVEFLGKIAPEDWEKPSACKDWSIADVIAHVVGQNFASRVRRGLAGNFSPPEGAPKVEDHDEDSFAASIFQRAFDTRKEWGPNLLDGLAEQLKDSLSAFKEVSPDQWDNLCYWPPGPEPVRTMLDMRISELTMHAWDARSRLQEDYHLSEGSVEVLTRTGDRAVRRAFRPDSNLNTPLVYRFQIGEPINGTRDIILGKEGGRVPADGWQDPDAIFRCDGETYVLVMYGRITPAEAQERGLLKVAGDSSLAADFGSRFKGG